MHLDTNFHITPHRLIFVVNKQEKILQLLFLRGCNYGKFLENLAFSSPKSCLSLSPAAGRQCGYNDKLKYVSFLRRHDVQNLIIILVNIFSKSHCNEI